MRASEIIHIGQAIMSQKGEGNTDVFHQQHFQLSDNGEAYRVAALNGLNRVELGKKEKEVE